ncbi:MAG: hypothetical protein HYW90_04055 [Candidatus Sungbacteria bacterium]|nr:hypothetical protein [Candidatus Sungbacteria bacterium]
MEVFSLNRIRARLSGLGATLKAGILLAAVLIVAWIVFTLWIFPSEIDELLSLFQVDKGLHFTGGFFAAGLLFVFLAARRKTVFIFAIVVIGVLWEVWEVAFLADQFLRFRNYPALWAVDTFFDLIFDVLGAYFFAEALDRESGEI